MAGKNTDQDKLAGALETVVEVLVGDKLESVRGSVADLDSTLSKRIVTVKKDSAAALEDAVKKLSAEITEAEERQKKALGDLDEQLRESTADLKNLVQKNLSNAEDRIKAVKEELEKGAVEREKKMMKELDSLAQGLSAVQLGLQQQIESTDRIQTLLNGLGTVFSGGQSMPMGPQQEPADADVSPGSSEEKIDNALDRMFPGDPPSK